MLDACASQEVRVFDGDYADEIRAAVCEVALASIEEKGSFSLAVPGGSVVSALGGIAPGSFDASKTHIFFCNEKVPSFPCIEGALKETEKIGIPKEQVHGVGEGSAAEIAASYTALLKSHPSIDNSGPVPSVDMMLLGTGPDGHCGCLFPDSAEIKASGTGQVVLAGNDDRADGDFVAVSLDVMNAAKVVIVSAAGAGRAEMVASALGGEFGPYDCPAGMVEGCVSPVPRSHSGPPRAHARTHPPAPQPALPGTCHACSFAASLIVVVHRVPRLQQGGHVLVHGQGVDCRV